MFINFTTIAPKERKLQKIDEVSMSDCGNDDPQTHAYSQDIIILFMRTN